LRARRPISAPVLTIWRDAWDRYCGPFLVGKPAVADAMYATVCTRFSPAPSNWTRNPPNWKNSRSDSNAEVAKKSGRDLTPVIVAMDSLRQLRYPVLA